jgi:hypothetical protein
MGSGIAEAVGKHALLYEPTEPPLERAREQLDVSLEESPGGASSASRKPPASDRVIYTTCFEDLSGADASPEPQPSGWTKSPASSRSGIRAEYNASQAPRSSGAMPKPAALSLLVASLATRLPSVVILARIARRSC